MGPSDYLSGPHKKHLAGKRFALDAYVKQAVTWLQTLGTDFFYSETRAFIHRGTDIDANGEHKEV
jgi:hypothetical protein